MSPEWRCPLNRGVPKVQKMKKTERGEHSVLYNNKFSRLFSLRSFNAQLSKKTRAKGVIKRQKDKQRTLKKWSSWFCQEIAYFSLLQIRIFSLLRHVIATLKLHHIKMLNRLIQIGLPVPQCLSPTFVRREHELSSRLVGQRLTILVRWKRLNYY